MKKKILGILIILVFSTSLLTSCSSDSSGSSLPLFNKWWYESTNFHDDVYFGSDGTYHQRRIINGTTYIATGTWVWVNKSEKIMKSNFDFGPGTVPGQDWFKFVTTEEHIFTSKMTVDDGATFFGNLTFNDTDN